MAERVVESGRVIPSGIPPTDPEAGAVIAGPETNFFTVVEQVYHQLYNEQPSGVQNTFVSKVESSEDPYQRRMLVTGEEKPLDCGWLGNNIGQLVIKNGEKPSKDLDAPKTVVEVYYAGAPDDQHWLLRPGESMRGLPRSATQLRLRCNGSVTVSIFLIPK